MYIHDFWLGILAALTAEFMMLIIVALIRAIRRRK